MTTREPNEIRELTAAQLDLVTGGSIPEAVRSYVKLAGAVAILTWAGAYSMTADATPDPWA
jgi:hypothetical protein